MALIPKLLRLLIVAAFGLFFLPACVSSNGVVNLSHYDAPRPDFAGMKSAGIIGIIHEATYPPNVGDEKYADRQEAATRAGLMWGAYHFANASDPVQQADAFLSFVGRKARSGSPSPQGVLLVLDFETNAHYPGGTMSVRQAITFIKRIHERTGKYPGLYSNENRIKQVISRSGVDVESQRVLRNCWLWVANYHHRPSTLAPWGDWTLWQYTGDGVCDLPRATHPIHICNVRAAERNFFNGSAGGLRDFWRKNAWQVGN